jgi:hypothetical protein
MIAHLSRRKTGLDVLLKALFYIYNSCSVLAYFILPKATCRVKECSGQVPSLSLEHKLHKTFVYPLF